ncbi:hypothetical protein AVDCRST_MAG81-313 [uncultured Synechococcales cyanobacterium]|uniref:Uncharacterized protein n=1 Tax=uncultured Synechococcales cyanobacterium TaxID=1936017 RepID=A0A6J4USR7_9CYAN|nr:hypothetical protein AVDCRST_MAG81-313 [uncultured Synechococcales cyanobacterium]
MRTSRTLDLQATDYRLLFISRFLGAAVGMSAKRELILLGDTINHDYS